MAYEYKNKLVNPANRNNSFDEYKSMVLEIEEVYSKARAFDHIKVIHDKNVNEMSISDTKCIEMIGNELERADDER